MVIVITVANFSEQIKLVTFKDGKYQTTETVYAIDTAVARCRDADRVTVLGSQSRASRLVEALTQAGIPTTHTK